MHRRAKAAGRPRGSVSGPHAHRAVDRRDDRCRRRGPSRRDLRDGLGSEWRRKKRDTIQRGRRGDGETKSGL